MSECQPVTASLVPEEARLNFLPTYFGEQLMMRAERVVYFCMSKLSEDYKGGLWNFYTLSNGGFYLAPADYGQMRVSVAGNWFKGELSADAAGIVATLFALPQVASVAQGLGLDAQADALIDHYYLLRDFAIAHEESSAIFGAID